MKITRRKLVISGIGLSLAGLAAVKGLPFGKTFIRRRIHPEFIDEGTDPSELDPSVSADIVALIGVLSGLVLTSQDQSELTARLQLLASSNTFWRQQLHELADFLDRKLGSPIREITTPTPNLRQVIDELLRSPADSRLAKIKALVDRDAANMRVFQRWTMPGLVRLYANSGVVWRARLYTNYPGIPGDPREYTKAGKRLEC